MEVELDLIKLNATEEEEVELEPKSSEVDINPFDHFIASPIDPSLPYQPINSIPEICLNLNNVSAIEPMPSNTHEITDVYNISSNQIKPNNSLGLYNIQHNPTSNINSASTSLPLIEYNPYTWDYSTYCQQVQSYSNGMNISFSGPYYSNGYSSVEYLGSDWVGHPPPHQPNATHILPRFRKKDFKRSKSTPTTKSKPAKVLPNNITPYSTAPSAGLSSQVIKRCSNCSANETPSWRRCKKADKLLCNACGLYEKLHDKDRPTYIDCDGFIKVKRNTRKDRIKEE